MNRAHRTGTTNRRGDRAGARHGEEPSTDLGADADRHPGHVHQFVSWNSDEQRVTRRVNSADDERGGEKEDAGAV